MEVTGGGSCPDSFLRGDHLVESQRRRSSTAQDRSAGGAGEAIMKWTLVTFFLLGRIGLAQTPPESPVPSNDEILKILTGRVDAQKQAIGIVVGVVEPKGRRVVSY